MGFYPSRGAEGRTLRAQAPGTPAGTGAGSRTAGPPQPPEGWRRHAGTHAVGPPREAGRRHHRQADRRGWTHEVSGADPGSCPGPKTARTRRRPAGHPGHCPMSTRVTWCRRAATNSGVAGPDGGIAVRSIRHRASLAVRPRLARNPKWRMRTRPLGRTGNWRPGVKAEGEAGATALAPWVWRQGA
jgi:hypothetical protein